jgi:hypothetical protein
MCKDRKSIDILLKNKNRIMKANTQNSTFASSISQADASACKRAVFLPAHPCTFITFIDLIK